MPDQLRKTVSATEVPALWNVSPWMTRWLLYRRFHDGVDISSPPNERMNWGLRLQPAIIEQAARDLKFEVRPNSDDRYHRRGSVGCTRDAEIICPDRGPGALETKCVFDYRDWMEKWGGGEFVPRHYEIQNQVQMMVGDTDGEPYRWGVIAAWVAGEVHYFERAPIPELWADVETEAARFLASVRDGDEPDPFGAPMELPFLSLIEHVAGKSIESDDVSLAQMAVAYAETGDIVSAANKRREEIKAKLLAAAGDAGEIRFNDGTVVSVKTQSRAGYEVKPTTFAVVKVRRSKVRAEE